MKAFWREAQHCPHIPTCVLRGVLEEHTTPESLEMVCNMLTKQSGSALHDSQVHVYDAVGHPVCKYILSLNTVLNNWSLLHSLMFIIATKDVRNRNGRILKNTDMGGAIQRSECALVLAKDPDTKTDDPYYLFTSQIDCKLKTKLLLFHLYILTAHHWSPLSDEVEYVRTTRDVQNACFDCAQDRHIFPWCDVNARFGIIRYAVTEGKSHVEESNSIVPEV